MLASLTLLASCICVRTEFNPSCYRGYYFNREVLECTPCSTCKDDQVVRRNCFNDQDTLCGALSEFQFIRPQKLREAADDFQQNLHQTAQVPTTSTEIVLESDDKWFTITMVLVGFLVVTCATGVIIVLVTCVVCRRKDREIIYEPGK